MVKVKFITAGANSAFGAFSAGDVLVCSEAMAKHLINDVCCAKYDVAKIETTPETKPEKKQRKSANV